MFFYFMNPLIADAEKTIEIGNAVTNYYYIASSVTMGNKIDVRKNNCISILWLNVVFTPL